LLKNVDYRKAIFIEFRVRKLINNVVIDLTILFEDYIGEWSAGFNGTD